MSRFQKIRRVARGDIKEEVYHHLIIKLLEKLNNKFVGRPLIAQVVKEVRLEFEDFLEDKMATQGYDFDEHFLRAIFEARILQNIKDQAGIVEDNELPEANEKPEENIDLQEWSKEIKRREDGKLI